MYCAYKEITGPPQCVSTAKVVDIISFNGTGRSNSVTIQLDNGKTMTIFRGNFKQGDKVCLTR